MRRSLVDTNATSFDTGNGVTISKQDLQRHGRSVFFRYFRKEIMRIKITTAFFAFILASLTASSQVTYKELNRFFQFSSNNLDVSKSFKDSVAMYTCNIQIVVESNNNFKPVISSTDQSVSNKILNLDTLLSYDYSKMVGRDKKVKFILPISIIILDSKYDPKLLDAHDIFIKILKLYYFNGEKDDEYKIIHLNPISVMVDKKNYH